ncbi:MAG: hypothetical protein ABIP94_05445, partial [Planctomycetota bacterium]
MALLLAVMLPGQVPSVEGGPSAPARERAERALADSDCQTSLPGGAESPGGASLPESHRPSGNGPRQRGGASAGPGLSMGGMGIAVGVAQFVLWFALVLAVVVLVVVIVRALRSKSEAPEKRMVPRAGTVPESLRPEPPLPDHAQLANGGDFAAAIHALLGHAFAVLSQRFGVLPVHATGREVLRRAGQQQVSTE